MGVAAFLSEWDRIAPGVYEALAEQGGEGYLLERVAAYRRAALALVRHAGSSQEPSRRKLAGMLLSYLPQESDAILNEMLDAEKLRVARAPDHAVAVPVAQSVVEDLVHAASRWCRDPASRPAALSFLRRIVEETVSGAAYWSTSTDAMISICRWDPRNARPLLERFAEMVEGYSRLGRLRLRLAGKPAVRHYRRNLSQERTHAQGLLRGERGTVTLIDTLLTEWDSTARAAVLDEEPLAVVARLLDLCAAADEELRAAEA